MAASPCGNHLAREGRLARASAQLLMHSHYVLAPFGNCNIVALVCRVVNWRRAVSYNRASATGIIVIDIPARGRKLTTVAQPCRYPVDGQMNCLHHALVSIAGSVTLQQFDLYMVEGIEIGK